MSIRRKTFLVNLGTMSNTATKEVTNDSLLAEAQTSLRRKNEIEKEMDQIGDQLASEAFSQIGLKKKLIDDEGFPSQESICIG